MESEYQMSDETISLATDNGTTEAGAAASDGDPALDSKLLEEISQRFHRLWKLEKDFEQLTRDHHSLAAAKKLVEHERQEWVDKRR
ncbi:uncharacterized protein ACA1_013230 [Acanthamoeba castellanii str. Neff]|uniref:Uncharacterized protein n=1 Tax=Acanthamoeba castellanii (strain ATCC 30010 / Neff) TaxID=1257118 RepID=L8H4W9_ACACF|nr:uncharacterized protein ACA1_013230 [Acanthamoeba castellanii str. Neff]ELR20272.1 hypothetical protein ACA1_013230 [Acanthamoeba castellanii str. Neff]